MERSDNSCQERDCTFTSHCERTLKAHIRAHFGINAKRWLPYTCSTCSGRYSTAEDLSRHIERQGKKEFQCGLCTESFYFKQALDTHVSIHHAEVVPHYANPYRCQHCNWSSRTSWGLQMHQSLRYGGKCLFGSESSSETATPPVDHVGEVGTPAVQTGSIRLTDPCTSIGGRDACRGILGSPESVVDRSTSESESRKNSPKFESVGPEYGPGLSGYGETFPHPRPDMSGLPAVAAATAAVLVAEISKNAEPPLLRNGETHPCQECKRSFSSKDNLNFHIRTSHADQFASDRKFRCNTCLKVCTTQSGLDYHHRTHLKTIEERRAYKCLECPQVFTVRSTLYRHQRTQHAATLDERKPYKCEYCGKAFASRYNLSRHADTRHPSGIKERNALK